MTITILHVDIRHLSNRMMDDWIECYECECGGVGEGGNDCFDDTCCCRNPEPDIFPLCKGEGGWTARIVEDEAEEEERESREGN